MFRQYCDIFPEEPEVEETPKKKKKKKKREVVAEEEEEEEALEEAPTTSTADEVSPYRLNHYTCDPVFCYSSAIIYGHIPILCIFSYCFHSLRKRRRRKRR